MKKLIVGCFFLLSHLAASNQLMVNISDLDVEADVMLDLATLFDRYGEDTYYVGAGLFSMDDGESPTMVYGKLFIQSKMKELEHVTLALGLKPLYLASDNRKFGCIPFGAVVKYEIPVEQGQIPLFIIASGFYGPKRLSFFDGMGYFEYRAGVAAQIEEAQGFVEYRSVYTTYETGQENINRTLYAGVRIFF